MTVVVPCSVGETARARCTEDGSAIIVQNFARSLLLRVPAGPVIVARAIEPGPLTVLLPDQPWTRISAARTWRVMDDALHADDIVIALAAAPVWSSPAWPEPNLESFPAVAQDLARFLANTAPPEGLARGIAGLICGEPIPPPTSGLGAHVHVAGIRRAETLAGWIRSGTGAPPVDLVGFGEGSTPSGDDALAGVLLVLAALRSPRQPHLAAAIRGATSGTSALSAALLEESAAGRAGEALTRTVAALVAGDGAAQFEAAAMVSRQGHSSGSDALAGVALAAAVLSGAL